MSAPLKKPFDAFFVLALVCLVTSGCHHRRRSRAPEFFPAAAVQIPSGNDGATRCIERLLLRSRTTGYIEQTVDKEMAFFRVMVKQQLARVDEKTLRRVPKNAVLAYVEFYNVQCIGPETALITPMNERGAVPANAVMDMMQYEELQRYARSIQSVATSPQAASILPPPPPPEE